MNVNETGAIKHQPDPEVPLYPNGWFPVIESRELNKIGELKPLFVFGRNFVCFRGTDGNVRVLDAYCPHLGAHLAVGGEVISNEGQDCIRCPFHGWEFNGKSGQCVKIPYAKEAGKREKYINKFI